MMKNTSLFILSIVVAIVMSADRVHACLNPVGQSTVSQPIYADELAPDEFLRELTTHEGSAHWLKVLAEVKLDVDASVAVRETNTAVAMLHLGMVSEAIRILEKLERTDPGLYYTAANLGTAYELNGENEKALKWIKEGIKRDAEAHHGSEWLHVRILEAKLALEKDPNWLASNSVVGLDRITSEQQLLSGNVATGNLGQPIDLKQVQEALIYQLHERLEFIKPPEGVVANLLFDLSRTLVRTRTHDHASVIRGFAGTYGADLRPWAVGDQVVPATVLPATVSTTPYWIAAGIVVFGSVLLVVILLVLWSRRRTRRR